MWKLCKRQFLPSQYICCILLIFEEVMKIICFVSLPFTAGIVVSKINGFSQNENGNNYLSDFGLKPNI